jgi:hypothetical protein
MRGSDGRFIKRPDQIRGSDGRFASTDATKTVGSKGYLGPVAGVAGGLTVLAGIVFALFNNGQPAQSTRITPIPGTSATTSQTVETSTVTSTPPDTLTETTTETSPVTVVVTRTEPAPPPETVTVTETTTEIAPLLP